MDRNGVDKTVLVQHKGEYDNSYLLDNARLHPDRFSVVGAVDPGQPDAPETLARWAGEGIEGLVLFSTDRSPGDDPLAIWRKAAELGLPVSCSGSSGDFASDHFRQVATELPDLRVIMEHMGVHESLRFLPQGESPEPPYTAYRKVLDLARYPNVFVKVPPLGELMPRPFPAREPTFLLDEAPPVIEMAIEAFGAQRLMFGVDYPPVSVREGYANAWRYMREHLTRRSREEQDAILGGTAATIFPFRIG